jgi:hypothetical protein
VGWLAPSPGRFNPGKDPVPIVQEAGWAPGPVWTGTENLAASGIRSPDGPSRNKSLYRLGYRGRHPLLYKTLFHLTTVTCHFPYTRLTDKTSTCEEQSVCWMSRVSESRKKTVSARYVYFVRKKNLILTPIQ